RRNPPGRRYAQKLKTPRKPMARRVAKKRLKSVDKRPRAGVRCDPSRHSSTTDRSDRPDTYAHLWPTAADSTRTAGQSLIDAAIPEILRRARAQYNASAVARIGRSTWSLDSGLGPRESPDIRDDQR